MVGRIGADVSLNRVVGKHPGGFGVVWDIRELCAHLQNISIDTYTELEGVNWYQLWVN